MSEKCAKSKSGKLKEIFFASKATKTAQIDKSPIDSPKSGRAYRRNLRQRRKATGIAISEETAQDTSDEGTQSPLTMAKKIAHFNQIFSVDAVNVPEDDLYLMNKKLREEILLKDDYIRSLEAKLRELKCDQRAVAKT